jgi:N-acetylglucosaminyldiphosphoundecaprenol N-acetyl-beta-D-mannosaminyltransferase
VGAQPLELDPVLAGHSCRRNGHGARVNGVRIDPTSPDRFLLAVDSFLRCGRSHVIHFLAADPTVLARRDPRYRDVLNLGDLNLPDGMAVAWASRMFGYPTPRFAGTDALTLTVARGVQWNLRHYLYGGSEEVLGNLRRHLETLYPTAVIAGAESPPFRPLSGEEIGAAAWRIRSSGAEAVWVGLGTPKQDIVAQQLRELEAAPLILCVGAAFDFVAGAKPRAPRWMRRSGMEWVFRLKSEPRRLWRRYLLGNPRFVAGLVVDLIGGAGTGPANVGTWNGSLPVNDGPRAATGAEEATKDAHRVRP